MRIKQFLVPLLAGTILLYACNRNSITLSYTNAKEEVPALGNLVFRFSKSLVHDSLLNRWDSTDYISFDPDIKGKFRWESPDQLVFSPAEPLLPATDYSAKFRKPLFKYSKYNDLEGDDKITFHTAPLLLDNSEVTWIGEAGGSAYPQVDLFFNYKVDPATLRDKLAIELEGSNATYQTITQSPDQRISVRINNTKQEDKDLNARIVIAKGLKPENGRNATVNPLTASVTIPSPFTLTVQNVESEHDGSEGLVRIATSQQVSSESLKAFVRLEPATTFTIEPQENGFTIRSDKFDVEKSYEVKILKGLRGKIGGILKEDYSGNIAFGQLEANIRFTNSKAVYLSKKGAANMEVQITNVPKVKLLISKIYENNLLMAERYGYYPQNVSYEEMEEGYVDDNVAETMVGDIIYEKEIDTRSLPKSGGGRILNLSQFEDRLGDFKGVYHVMISSTESFWVRDSRFISLSDIGLIAKEGSDKIYVFSNSLKTAEPISGVNVAVYGSNNQLLGSASTNNNGVAEVAYTRRDFKGFKPAMVIAKTADDFNYLPFRNTRVNTSRFEVGGKRINSSGLDAFVYPERDIYRPGERVNFSVVVRDNQWKSPGDIPIKLKFLMPNGKELKTFRKSLNEQGAAEGNIDIAASAITGSYTLEVYTSNDILLTTQNFSIEEFVPDRIRVQSTLSKKVLLPGDSTKLSINAMNFFGPPAANRKYETEIQVKQKYFSPEKFSDYDFSLENRTSVFDKVVREGKTDEQGNAVISYDVPASYTNMGVLQTNFYSTVFDETGRPVSRAASADIFTQDVFFGMKGDGFYYSPLNQATKFELVAVNKDGNGVSATATVKVIKHEYRTSLRKSGSYFRYESQKEDRTIEERQITIGTKSIYSFVPRSPGDYEIRVYRPGSASYISSSFYSYGSWGGNNSSFAVNNEGNIEISLDKKSHFAGESVTALFKTPFSGKMLVTLESDHLISYQYLEVSKRSVSLDLPLNGDHVPNVYITATLIKPHEQSDIPLTVAHGFQNVKVEEKSRLIATEIKAEKNVRSRTKQQVTVKASPGSYVTLAAVDNGVLQVSGFRTPDPYNYFYQQRALQVNAFDLYPYLFAEIRTRMSSTGGDADLEMEKRVNPMPAKRIKVVSYWSGLKKANGNGEATFEFNIPQFSGELRLMAVSIKGNCFGSSEAAMTVADPIVISSALPRFLSPGDTVTVPVTISNTTNKSMNTTASISADGMVKVVGQNSMAAAVNSKGESRVIFKIVAANTIGTSNIRVLVNGGGEKFEEATEISVRPPSTLQKITGSSSVNGGATQKVNIALGELIPSSIKYNLVISRSPAVELGQHLKWLVQYPYGCTEQTVSAAFPQLYYSDLSELVQSGTGNKVNANNNIIEAIRKIKMRQLYTGAVTLWDGEGEEDWWVTIYSAHFLLEAKKAGFDVDNGLLETMLSYINNRLKTRETITYYYNRDQNKKIAPKEVAYGLYVLALANRPNSSAMNYYKSKPEILALDSRYLLSAAYAAAGDRKSFAAMLPSSFAGEESVPQSGGSYYSDVRDESIALNALIESDPANRQIPVMAQHVSNKLKTRRWLNTQERSFSFLALGKLARAANASSATAEVRVNGKTIAKVDNGQWKGDTKSLGGNNIEISVKGDGRIYYFWEAEGISATGSYNEEDSYLRVRRRFYDRFGNPVTGNNFKQNDLIIVGITLERAFNTTIENVVITDLLPAGFEIENPRTKEIPGMEWIKDASTPTALDVRDDRIHFFVDAGSGKQNYYYAVRAVSPGSYKMGPVSADAMYNGEYHSYHGAGLIKIQ